jgi:predicted anti-sigma-YlaC factor YlaD
MNCERIAELLPDYLQGSLSSEQQRIVEEHLQNCAACFDEVAVWKKMSVLPTEQPSPESRARFEAVLQAFPSAEAEVPARTLVAARPNAGWAAVMQWFRTPVGALAWSVALIVIGIAIGTRLGGKDTSRSVEIAAMHSELASMKQLVVLSMLTQQSASERLQGVNYSNREDHLDPQVLAALLRTLRYDNSVDVRLAALDTLSRHANQPQIRKSVVDSLQEQQSPMVQVALIDLLSEWRDPDAAQRLRNFQQTKNLNPTVRQRAEWAVSKLQ